MSLIKQIHSTLFMLFSLFIIITECCDDYFVPNPKITVYEPSGFSVSVPDSPGISIFAFHGNINKPMEDLEAGDFSRDVLKKSKNRWVFKDRKTVLEVGDKIYYWLFVVKNKLGYRYDDGVFEVTEKVPAPEGFFGSANSEENPALYRSRPTRIPQLECPENSPPTANTNKNNLREQYQSCQLKTINLTIVNQELETQLDSLKETIRILTDLINKNSSLPAYTKLTILGPFPPDEEPRYFVDIFLREKLKLTKIHVQDAERNGARIIFHVNGINEKLGVIQAANKHLTDSKFSLSY